MVLSTVRLMGPLAPVSLMMARAAAGEAANAMAATTMPSPSAASGEPTSRPGSAMAGMKPLINTTNAVTETITSVYWPAMMDSITRMPSRTAASLSSPPALMAMRAMASVSNRLSCWMTLSFSTPRSKGAQGASTPTHDAT
jgi:hypothetical protein